MTSEHTTIKEDRILLILDLDETLVYAAASPLPQPADFIVGPYYVYRRPGLSEFLLACSECYRIAVWSSSSDDYAVSVISQIMPRDVVVGFVWGRSRCTRKIDHELQEEYYLKDLRRVKQRGYDLRRVLIVEDSPRKVARNYGNAIYVSPYEGDASDDELPQLASYLRSICSLADVRRLEKRNWRTCTLFRSPR